MATTQAFLNTTELVVTAGAVGVASTTAGILALRGMRTIQAALPIQNSTANALVAGVALTTALGFGLRTAGFQNGLSAAFQ